MHRPPADRQESAPERQARWQRPEIRRSQARRFPFRGSGSRRQLTTTPGRGELWRDGGRRRVGAGGWPRRSRTNDLDCGSGVPGMRVQPQAGRRRLSRWSRPSLRRGQQEQEKKSAGRCRAGARLEKAPPAAAADQRRGRCWGSLGAPSMNAPGGADRTARGQTKRETRRRSRELRRATGERRGVPHMRSTRSTWDDKKTPHGRGRFPEANGLAPCLARPTLPLDCARGRLAREQKRPDVSPERFPPVMI